MDLNHLLFRHQRALIDSSMGSSPAARRWAGLSATFYGEQIAKVRDALGREDPFTWGSANRGIVACG
jgi:hypothetical protein